VLPRIDGLTDLVEVGRGGFGTVFRATEARFGRAVAIKTIRGDSGVGKNIVARFERECLALGSLSGHPNIVAVYDSGTTEDGDRYIVMEYLSGGSLAERIAQRGPATGDEVAEWGAALAGALETAHRAGIIHRDVKPENVMFSEYGTPKLVDFGISRMRSAYETRSGFLSATLNHAAPEIVAGSELTPSADIYSLASVLFTLLRGRAPFDEGSEFSLAPMIARIATAQPPDLRKLGVPDALVKVIEQGLNKAPGERFSTAGAFGAALQRAAQEMSGREVAVPLGLADEVAEAAAVVDSGPITIDPEEDVTPSDRQGETITGFEPPTPNPKLEETPVFEPVRRRGGRIVAIVAALTLVVGGSSAAFALWPDGKDRANVDKGKPSAKPDITPPVLSQASLTRDELQGGFTVKASDDSGSVKVTISGVLPQGLTRSGGAVSGRISADAVTSRTTYKKPRFRQFPLQLTATDPTGLKTTRRIVITVADSHVTLPNYVGKYGDKDVSPTVDELAGKARSSYFPQGERTCLDPGSRGDGKIGFQTIAPGTPYRWGARIGFKYSQPTGDLPPC